MATYTYKCEKCEVVFEVTQSMKDDALTDCPECEAKDTLKKIITGGGGFRIYGKGVHKPTSRLG